MTPVLFLPGLACDARLYWHQLIALSARHPVLFCPLGDEGTIEGMARKVLEQAPPRFIAVGHCLGAYVAVELQRRAPERVERLALISINPITETASAGAERELRIARARAGRLTEVVLEETPAAALAPWRENEPSRAILVDMAEALGAETFAAQSRALMRRPDQTRGLRSARVPILVIGGAHDTICPPRRHQFLAELVPDGRFEPVESAGHLPTLEAPAEVSALLLAFCEPDEAGQTGASGAR